MAAARGLGKGLDALFAESVQESGSGATLRISQIEPNRDQPRKNFDINALEELCDSIKLHGVLQPLVVRPMPNGKYQLIAGERRWRAARMAELTEVPVVIKDITDAEAMEIALIENLQREDLNPIEEALGYENLMKTLGLTQDEAARKMGKARSTVANSLRLLGLPDSIKKMVSAGEISPSGARTVLSLPEGAWDDAAKMLKNGATVREIEKLARETAGNPAREVKPKGDKKKRDTYFDEAEIALSSLFGHPVHIADKARGGTLNISFYGLEDLKEIMKLLEKLS